MQNFNTTIEKRHSPIDNMRRLSEISFRKSYRTICSAKAFEKGSQIMHLAKTFEKKFLNHAFG